MRCREVKWKHQIICWHRSRPDWDPARQSCTFNSHSWVRPCPYSNNREMVACPAQSDSRDASDLCSSCQMCPQRQLETHRVPLILLCLWLHAAVQFPCPRPWSFSPTANKPALWHPQPCSQFPITQSNSVSCFSDFP